MNFLNHECTEIAQARLSGLQKQFGYPPAQEFQCVSDPCCLHDIQEIIQKQSPNTAPGPSGGYFGHLQHLYLSFVEDLLAFITVFCVLEFGLSSGYMALFIPSRKEKGCTA